MLLLRYRARSHTIPRHEPARLDLNKRDFALGPVSAAPRICLVGGYYGYTGGPLQIVDGVDGPRRRGFCSGAPNRCKVHKVHGAKDEPFYYWATGTWSKTWSWGP